jgi:hypothetical protein
VRAYDRDNGKELWVRDLPSGSEGMPATYPVNGRQFIVFPVATAGGQFTANYNQPPRGAGPAPAPTAPEAAAVQGAGAAAPDAGGRGGRGGRAGRGGGGQAGPPGAYIAFALPR